MEAMLKLSPHLDIKSICYLSPKPMISVHQNFLPLTRSRVIMYSSSSPTPPGYLDNVRNSLIRQEDTIIFSLLERVQYSYDSVACDNDGLFPDDLDGSIAEYMAVQKETLYAKLGRYKSEEENPFFPRHLPRSILPHQQYPKILHRCADSININHKIWNIYFKEIVPELIKARNNDESGSSIPELVKAGNNYECGSIAVCDILCLQALSKRIHYGKFVAEAKFQDDPSEYEAAIKAKDRKLLLELLTYETVEATVKKRVELKAKTFGQVVKIDEDNVANPTYKIKPSFIPKLFEDIVMPFTKEVQVEYLLRRLD
ncbi:chorismate mutase 3, chloroplastic-like [Vigna umbellata]|uniref:chorismate mutase 3, chloroplastic-like n=1 Tax=Vigna umbellata TaxID=87088 RepID=UPI001F5FAD97|nr:chorismate mutase 3, chloroplastic-like [Vigna umbellata]